jgi:hypothetical protein
MGTSVVTIRLSQTRAATRSVAVKSTSSPASTACTAVEPGLHRLYRGSCVDPLSHRTVLMTGMTVFGDSYVAASVPAAFALLGAAVVILAFRAKGTPAQAREAPEPAVVERAG